MTNYAELIEAIKELASAVRSCEITLTVICIVLIFKNTNSNEAIYRVGDSIKDAIMRLTR